MNPFWPTAGKGPAKEEVKGGGGGEDDVADAGGVLDRCWLLLLFILLACGSFCLSIQSCQWAVLRWSWTSWNGTYEWSCSFVVVASRNRVYPKAFYRDFLYGTDELPLW